jgi:hypothetical protein
VNFVSEPPADRRFSSVVRTGDLHVTNNGRLHWHRIRLARSDARTSFANPSRNGAPGRRGGSGSGVEVAGGVQARLMYGRNLRHLREGMGSGPADMARAVSLSIAWFARLQAERRSHIQALLVRTGAGAAMTAPDRDRVAGNRS